MPVNNRNAEEFKATTVTIHDTNPSPLGYGVPPWNMPIALKRKAWTWIRVDNDRLFIAMEVEDDGLPDAEFPGTKVYSAADLSIVPDDSHDSTGGWTGRTLDSEFTGPPCSTILEALMALRNHLRSRGVYAESPFEGAGS